MAVGNPKQCLICHSKTYRVIFSSNEPDQYERAVGITKKGYFRKWVECKKCGFRYLIYSRPKDAMNKIYDSAYRDKNSSWRKSSPEEIFERIIALKEDESETKFRVKWIKRNINDIWKYGLLKQNTPPYKTLDIGGGTGVFAYEFQDANWITHVIDPNKDGKFIKTKLNIPFIQDYYKPNSFNCKFDLISLIYVLEHISDPVSLLKSLYTNISDNSLIFIEVPDAICFKYKPIEDDIFNSCHLWMFSPDTLTYLLDSCGFEVFNLYRMQTIRGHYALMVLAGQKYTLKEKK